MRELTTDDDPVYGPALEVTGLDQPQCVMHMQRTVGRHIRGIGEDELTHRDRVRLQPEVRKRLWHLVEQWHNLVRSQGNPTVPASTHLLEG